jgi:transketolase
MTATDSATALDNLCVDTIRTLSMDAVQNANSGHPGTPMALAPLVYVLYTRIMRHNPSDADWFNRDRFVLSAGHASMLLYSILYLTGYPMTLDDIKHFRKVGYPTAGHPERKYSPGIEATTGPLGQGISMAVGLALAERMLAARFNRPDHGEIVDHYTFTIASDGDVQEGVASEASSLAGHLGLGGLIAFYDNNHVQLAGPTSQSFSEDVALRYEAYDWHVQDVGEDLSLDRLEEATRAAMAEQDRPSLIIVRSHIGYGSPHKQDTSAAHGSPLGEDEVRLVKEAYGWDPDKHFYVPEDALAHFRRCCERGRDFQAEWEGRLAAYRQEYPQEAKELEMIAAAEMPEGWDSDVPRFDPGDDPLATRQASGAAIQWAAARVPHLVGGSADLATSTNTDIKEGGDVEKHQYGGRNLRFGVREHGMGAITNGLNLHGFRAYGATFLTFSDYMKGALRLCALMKLPAVWVYTHDSIGLGEDGPTHQPIEQLAGLRAMPRMNVVRPADANETALAWRFALRSTENPTALSLTRQTLPILDPDRIPDDAIERGAYVLSDADGGDPELILIATGSEVSLCMEAAKLLDGVRVRVVSMPCMDTFTKAGEAYREQVLPASCRARIAVEAASPMGWAKWIGEEGAFIGMETFGESGPYKDVYEHFGITAQRVAEVGRELIGR